MSSHETVQGLAFPRDVRLTRARDFERVLRRPRIRLKAGPLRLNAVFNRMHSARLGLIVGKKAVARANARNRIKRIIREQFRQRRAQLAPLDIVVRVTAPSTAAGLHQHLETLFSELASRADDPPGIGC